MSKKRLSREQRLRRQADFDRVHQGQAYAADNILVLKAARNELGYTRLGVSLSRKVGNAVLRNRWKRLVREAFRLDQDRFPTSLDLIIRPRKGAVPDFASIRASLLSLSRRVERSVARHP